MLIPAYLRVALLMRFRLICWSQLVLLRFLGGQAIGDELCPTPTPHLDNCCSWRYPKTATEVVQLRLCLQKDGVVNTRP